MGIQYLRQDKPTPGRTGWWRMKGEGIRRGEGISWAQLRIFYPFSHPSTGKQEIIWQCRFVRFQPCFIPSNPGIRHPGCMGSHSSEPGYATGAPRVSMRTYLTVEEGNLVLIGAGEETWMDDHDPLLQGPTSPPGSGALGFPSWPSNACENT